MFDKDGGGSISEDELKEVLSLGQNIDQFTIDKIFMQADTDGDGQISFEEFIKMMKSGLKKKVNF